MSDDISSEQGLLNRRDSRRMGHPLLPKQKIFFSLIKNFPWKKKLKFWHIARNVYWPVVYFLTQLQKFITKNVKENQWNWKFHWGSIVASISVASLAIIQRIIFAIENWVKNVTCPTLIDVIFPTTHSKSRRGIVDRTNNIRFNANWFTWFPRGWEWLFLAFY